MKMKKLLSLLLAALLILSSVPLSAFASDGTVTFESSSNVLNTIGALLGITGNVVDSDTLAQILETASAPLLTSRS